MEESWLKRNIPILSWLPAYDRSWLSVDIVAGFDALGAGGAASNGLCRNCRFAAAGRSLYTGCITA